MGKTFSLPQKIRPACPVPPSGPTQGFQMKKGPRVSRGERVKYPSTEEHGQTNDAEGRCHTRDERARDGVSRDERRGIEWAAEGAPNGRPSQ